MADKTFQTRVVGSEDPACQAAISGLSRGLQVYLRREPNNPGSPYAISVEDAHGRRIGYVEATLAAEIAPKIDMYRAAVLARITDITKQGMLKRHSVVDISFSLPGWLYDAEPYLKDFQALDWEAAQPKLRPHLKARMPYISGEPTSIGIDWLPELNLVLYLAIDWEHMIEHVTQLHLQRWGVTIEDVLAVALTNLYYVPVAAPVPLPAPDGTLGALVFNSNDGYDATRLILPEFRKSLCQGLGTDVCFVGIPYRDFLIAFVPHGYAGRYIQNIQLDVTRMRHPLTPEIFAVRSDGEFHRANVSIRTTPGGQMIFLSESFTFKFYFLPVL